MGSQLARAFQEPLGDVYSYYVMAVISEHLRQDSRPAGNIENPGASRDTSQSKELRSQQFALSSHERLISRRICPIILRLWRGYYILPLIA